MSGIKSLPVLSPLLVSSWLLVTEALYPVFLEAPLSSIFRAGYTASPAFSVPGCLLPHGHPKLLLCADRLSARALAAYVNGGRWLGPHLLRS